VTQTLVTSGTMTNRVDRLTGRGLVERLPDPRDRRGVIVRLTAEGLRTVDDAFAGLLERERALLAGLAAEERGQLAALLRRLVSPFDAIT
jgi:DNA-binding MarR family transcriptional regulator